MNQDPWDQLDGEVGRWLLGLPSDTDVPAAARAAVDDGCEGAALEQLAALTQPDRWQLVELLNRMYRERGREFPLSNDAVSATANDALIRMLSGEVAFDDALDTLRRLWERLMAGGEQWHDLEYFREHAISLDLAADSDLDYEMPPDWKSDVVAEAQRILRRGGVRPGYHDDDE